MRSTVVVTASDTPQSVDEVSKAISVVDRQDIDDRDESQIAESLRTVPGLRVQQLGGPVRSPRSRHAVCAMKTPQC